MPRALAAASLSSLNTARALRMSSRSTSARAGTLAGAHSEGALDEVLELTDIAGKRVGRQRRQRLGRDPAHVAMETLVEPAQEVVDQRRDVLGARAAAAASRA